MQSLKLEFKEIAFIDRNEGFIEDFHVHNWFDFSFVLKGSINYEIDGNVYTVNEGDVVVVAPGKAHKEICDSNKHFEVLFVCVSFTKSNLVFNITEHLGIPEVTHLNNMKEFYEIFEVILNEVTYRNDGYLLKINAQIYNLIVAICRNSKAFEAKADSIKKISNLRKNKIAEEIKEYMEQNFSQKISLNELSKEFFLSPQYISSVFSTQTGYTPIEYLNKIRIVKAKELFLSGNDNISKVAEQVGISDIHYFYKVFKQVEKKTPTQFIMQSDQKID